MKALFIALSAISALCMCSVHSLRPLIRLPRDAEKTGRYIAVLTENTSHQRMIEIVEMLQRIPDCQVHDHIEVTIKAIVLDLSDDALQKARELPEIDYIEEEGIHYAAQTQLQYGASGSGGGAGNIEDLWYQTRIDHLPQQGEGIDVYILDTGIRFDHQEFDYRAKYGGYDPVDNYEYGLGDYVPMRGADCHGHGTAVASLVGGRIYGKAKKANLYSVRVLRCDTTAPSSVILDGLSFVGEVVSKRGQNAVVVMALSGSPSNHINQSIAELNGRNVMVVTAAGNDGIDACEKTPSSSPYAITVGATDRHDNIAPKSNYGPCVDLFAPGEDILAASNECDSCTDKRSGSTMSAAITAGVVTAYFSQFPHFTPFLMRERLLHMSIPNVINLSSIPEEMQSKTPNQLLNRGCGGIVPVFLNNEGILHSPDFPGHYPTNLRCKWTLIAERDCDYVILNFTHIILEEHYDELKVCLKDVCDEDEKMIISGDYGTPNCILESVGQYMTIEMTTDSFTNGPGFRATHIATDTQRSWRNNRCTSRLNSINSTIQLDVYSAGRYFGSRFSIEKGWNEVFAGRKGGINFVTIDQYNGSVLSTGHFKTHSSSDDPSTGLIRYIEGVPFGAIVCVAVSYDGVYDLSQYAKQNLMWLGSYDINKLMQYGSWALIGVKGALPGQAIEVVSSNSPAHVWGRVHLKQYRQPIFELAAESAGTDSGKYARITVNGTVVDVPYNGYDRGLHVVVLHEVTGLITNSKVFDTSAETGAHSSSDQFVELISELSEGRIVVIAIKDEAIDHLSEDAKKACESIGSAHIRQVLHSGSWAIIGRKGAEIGSVPESYRNVGISKVTFISSTPNAHCTIRMQSLQYSGSGTSITVNGNKTIHPTSITEGNIILVLKDGECSVESSLSVRSSDEMADFLKYIPPGRTVLVNIAHNYRSLSEAGIAAMEAIGSAQIRSVTPYDTPWAIVGKKGAPRGSSMELSFYGEGKAFETSIEVAKTNTSLGFVGFITIKSGGTDFGNFGIINVDGQIFSLPPEYDSCITVVTIDEVTMSIVNVNAYNMTATVVNDTREENADNELFVDMTESLASGTIVAMVTNNAAALNESDEVKVTIERLGSKYIDKATEGGSWAMLTRKGALPGSALEAGSNDGPVEVATHTLPADPKKSDHVNCTIFADSAGTGSHGGLHLKINGKNITDSVLSNIGIRLVVLKENSCEIEFIGSYPLYEHYNHISYLTSRLNGVTHGKIVIASVYGSAYESDPYRRYGSYYYRRYYTPRVNDLKLAMHGIGSSMFNRVTFRDAWVIIGRKGASPGSVPESYVASVSYDQSSAVAVGGVMKPFAKWLCEDELYSIDCLIHK